MGTALRKDIERRLYLQAPTGRIRHHRHPPRGTSPCRRRSSSNGADRDKTFDSRARLGPMPYPSPAQPPALRSEPALSGCSRAVLRLYIRRIYRKSELAGPSSRGSYVEFLRAAELARQVGLLSYTYMRAIYALVSRRWLRVVEWLKKVRGGVRRMRVLLGGWMRPPSGRLLKAMAHCPSRGAHSLSRSITALRDRARAGSQAHAACTRSVSS